MKAWFRKEKYTTLTTPPARGRVPEGLLIKCPHCLESVVKKTWEEGYKVCPGCGFHDHLNARERIVQLLDPDSFVERDADLVSGDPLEFHDSKPYPQRIREACEKTGINEAVVCGIGMIEEHPAAVAIMDGSFIGGSMGSVVGEKIARTVEDGLAKRLPVVLVCCSGGARMQEGVLSLMQMAKTSALIGRLHETRLPLITILTDPTTGGVTASFASLGDVIIAEPGALIGFAGPRVIEATIKQVMPAGFQRSQFLLEHGFVDMVCERSQLRPTIGNLLDCLLHSRRTFGPLPSATHEMILAESSGEA